MNVRTIRGIAKNDRIPKWECVWKDRFDQERNEETKKKGRL